jgi:Uma2 family endonuclease
MHTSWVESAESIIYPSSDNEPLAETFIHLYAILTTLEVLKQYLEGQQATVLANQFLYYAQGFPKMRVAPDVMVIYDVAPGGRDNYKMWEEGQAPSVVFEMTSAFTQEQDKVTKKSLYEQMGVKEYWLFDPKGEWVKGQLQGYRLAPVTVEGEETELYVPITDDRSEPLELRVLVEGQVLGVYREDTGEKLLLPTELAEELRRTVDSLEQERSRAKQANQRAERLAERLRQLGEDPDQYV